MDGSRRGPLLAAKPALALALALASAALLAACLPADRAEAQNASDGATVQYEPSEWPFMISVSGKGQLELEQVVQRAKLSGGRVAGTVVPALPQSRAASSGIVVRDGATELTVSSGQVLVFRFVADQGATLVSAKVNGRDVTDDLTADGRLMLPAEDAQIALDVAFSETAAGGEGALGAGTYPASLGGGTAAGLSQTGDPLTAWPVVLLAALAALALLLAAVTALRSHRQAKQAPAPAAHASFEPPWSPVGRLYEDDGR